MARANWLLAWAISTPGAVGQDVLPGNAPPAFAAGAGRKHIVLRPHAGGAGPRQAGEGGDVEQRNRQHRIAQARPAHGTEQMAVSSAGKARLKSARRRVSCSTQPRRAAASRPRPVPSSRPRPTATRPTARGAAGTDQQLAGNIAAIGIGAQPVLGAGRGKALGQVHGLKGVGVSTATTGRRPAPGRW